MNEEGDRETKKRSGRCEGEEKVGLCVPIVSGLCCKRRKSTLIAYLTDALLPEDKVSL